MKEYYSTGTPNGNSRAGTTGAARRRRPEHGTASDGLQQEG